MLLHPPITNILLPTATFQAISHCSISLGNPNRGLKDLTALEIPTTKQQVVGGVSTRNILAGKSEKKN
jgi:hypothetical protein